MMLSVESSVRMRATEERNLSKSVGPGDIPLWFELLESFALGVVADDSGVEVAAQVELLRTELGHRGPRVWMAVIVVSGEIHASRIESWRVFAACWSEFH